MAQTIDLEGLPDPVAKAIAETVLNLKSHYRRERDKTATPLKDLPSRPGKVIDRYAVLTSMKSGLLDHLYSSNSRTREFHAQNSQE
jgi:hypothetical protein